METEIYNTDIEMLVDLLKLNFNFDSLSGLPDTSNEKLSENLVLQKNLLDIINNSPEKKSKRIESAYNILSDIYHRNKKSLSDRLLNNKNNHIIVLFYRTTCGDCKRIMGEWDKFVEHYSGSEFKIISYDGDNQDNMKIFKYFKITDVPTVLKLRLDTKDRETMITKMSDNISYETLRNFATF